MTKLSPYGGHTSVTIYVRRESLPDVCVDLHVHLGTVPEWDSPNRMLLPDGMRSFGLISGMGGAPAWGSFTDLQRRSFSMVRSSTGSLRAIPVSHLGAYFGWSDPSGVRVEFH